MKLYGFTLIETIISLAILIVIAIGTSTAFSTAGNIFRHTEDIKQMAENSSLKMTQLYENVNISSDNQCSFKINDNIIINGELLEITSNNNSDFSGYYSVKPLPHTIESEVDNDKN